MNNLIEYLGYRARIEYSADDDLLVGRVIDIDDTVTFHGTSIDEVKKEMKASVEFHIDVSGRSK